MYIKFNFTLLSTTLRSRDSCLKIALVKLKDMPADNFFFPLPFLLRPLALFLQSFTSTLPQTANCYEQGQKTIEERKEILHEIKWRIRSLQACTIKKTGTMCGKGKWEAVFFSSLLEI